MYLWKARVNKRKQWRLLQNRESKRVSLELMLPLNSTLLCLLWRTYFTSYVPISFFLGTERTQISMLTPIQLSVSPKKLWELMKNDGKSFLEEPNVVLVTQRHKNLLMTCQERHKLLQQRAWFSYKILHRDEDSKHKRQK